MSYSNYDVAHRWANGIGDSCHGSNMFFEGDSIYSYGYHFRMAMKYKGVVLYNENRYSTTTAKHQSYVRGAAWQRIVPCAELTSYDPGSKAFFEANMKAWKEDIENIIKGKLANARKPEKYFNEIARIINKAKDLCNILDEKLPKVFVKYDEQMSREDMVEAMRAEAKRERAAALRKRRKAEKEAVERFLKFKTDYFHGDYQIVRYRPEKNRFETSLRVQIPYEMGLAFYRRLRDGVLQVGDKVLYYTVHSIGDIIRIGCHTFKKSYLLDYGKQMFNE